MFGSVRGRRAPAVAAVLGALAVMSLAACGSDGDAASSDGKFMVCFGAGGKSAPWETGQGDVAEQLAKERGWDYYELNNDEDGPTTNKNADLFLQKGCDAVVMFNSSVSVNPVIAEKFKAADIPVITFDIPNDGWYFVGIDNQKAGVAGGEALGELAKSEWNCDVDLVVSAEQEPAGEVNEWRTGGMRDGVKSVCPDIPEDKFVSFESGGTVAEGQPKARDLLTANPDAENILVVGINDGGVLGAINAADQLGRGDNVMAWGQDGAYITGKNVDPHLKGSVFYFLEGYPTYAFTEILDKIADGNPPEVVDDPTADGAILLPPCPVSAEEAAGVPDMEGRIQELFKSPDSNAYDLFCPAASAS